MGAGLFIFYARSIIGHPVLQDCDKLSNFIFRSTAIGLKN